MRGQSQVIAQGSFEAAFPSMSSILKYLDGIDTVTALFMFQFLFFCARTLKAWPNSVPAASCWIQSDTMRKDGLVSAWFFLTARSFLPQSNVQE